MHVNRISLILLILAASLSMVKAQLQEIDIVKLWNSNSTNSHDNLQIPRALFVTSWNSQGRKYAIQYANKFESIILCLYDLRFQNRKFYLQKLIDIEPTFLKQAKRANPNIKLILRIYVSSSSKSIFEYVSSSTKKISDLSIEIIRIMRKEKANGIFYDSIYNLPVKMSAIQNYGPYDKFAILLNSYIVNRLREELTQKQKIIYGIKLEEWNVQDIDFVSIKQLKVNAFMIQSLDNNLADLSMKKSLSFIKEIRTINKSIEIYVTLPLFSWRNGIGMKTTTIKSYLLKNGVGFRGFKHGLCYYIQKNGGAQNSVPCDHYYEVARQYAQDFNFKLAYFQAGDAIQNQFDMI